MCIRNIREVKIKPKYGYKLFIRDRKGNLLHEYANINVKEEGFQKAESMDNINPKIRYEVEYNKNHKGKYCVFLNIKDAYLYSRRTGVVTEVWKVRIKYNKLLIGIASHMYIPTCNAGLVDEFELVKRESILLPRDIYVC